RADLRALAVSRARAGVLHLRDRPARPGRTLRRRGSRRRRSEEAPGAGPAAHHAAPGDRAAPDVGARGGAAHLLGSAGGRVTTDVRPPRQPAGGDPFLLSALSAQFAAPRLRLRGLAHPALVPEGRGQTPGGAAGLASAEGP